MRKLQLLIITGSLACSLLTTKAQIHSGKYENDLTFSNLKGKVKSCEKFVYYRPVTSDTIDTGWVYKSILNYNLQGNSISYYAYNGAPEYNVTIGLNLLMMRKGGKLILKTRQGK